MKNHLLGIQDHHNIIENWFKLDNQYSWLRAFENLDCKTSVLLKIKEKKYLSKKIRK